MQTNCTHIKNKTKQHLASAAIKECKSKATMRPSFIASVAEAVEELLIQMCSAAATLLSISF